LVLIIGGAYQGKMAFAMEKFKIAPDDPRLVKDFHGRVREQMEHDQDPLADLPHWRDKIILCDDIFCGVVPLDPPTRQWRETLGRCLIRVAAEADEVYRVFCGLGIKIK
jgi:adenosyl cobinamide kinase/adenosyl cobinamide phosphate guanylyltransferase